MTTNQNRCPCNEVKAARWGSADYRARMAALKASIIANRMRSVRVADGSYGVSFNGKGVAVLCFVPD